MTSLGQILSQYRRDKGFSQNKLAGLLQVDQSYVSKIETGERPISDIDFLKRVSERLSIPPEQLGLSGSGSAAVAQQGGNPEIIQAWGSIVSLAESSRSRGDSETAIKELMAVVPQIEAAPKASPELLVRAKLTLGVALGDRLPSRNLGLPVRLLKEAAAVDCTDRALRVQVWRAYGNELRKSDQIEEALSCLVKAKALMTASEVDGPLAIAIARAQAARQNWSDFQRAITDAYRILDTPKGELPLFNPAVVQEAVTRGYLSQGHADGIVRELKNPVMESFNTAPQWRAIRLVTWAEAHLFTAEIESAIQLLKSALSAADDLRLPQLVERISKVTRKYRKRSGTVGDLNDAAKGVLQRLIDVRSLGVKVVSVRS